MKFRMLVIALSVVASFNATSSVHGMKRGINWERQVKVLENQLFKDFKILGVGHPIGRIRNTGTDESVSRDESGNTFLHLIAQEDLNVNNEGLKLALSFSLSDLFDFENNADFKNLKDEFMVGLMIKWFLYFGAVFKKKESKINSREQGFEMKPSTHPSGLYDTEYVVDMTDPVITQKGLGDFIKDSNDEIIQYFQKLLNAKNNNGKTPLEVARDQSEDSKKTIFLAEITAVLEARSQSQQSLQ